MNELYPARLGSYPNDYAWLAGFDEQPVEPEPVCKRDPGLGTFGGGGPCT